MSDRPKISSTFARSVAATKETDLEVVPAPRSSQNSVPPPPSSQNAMRPRASTGNRPPPRRHTGPGVPPPAPSSRPSTPGATLSSSGAQKTTSYHLGDDDLRPLEQLSPLLIGTDFSIRRGIVLGGRFRVTQLIGAGAQCYVYAAEHTTLKSQVAIKCLQPALVTPELVERFAREAQALTSIRNAHVAAVLDVGRAPCGTPFIVMEYLEGADLSALLETRPRLEQRQAAEIVLQTCEGLAAAHALGLVHQDIKPSNIFLSDEMGIVKAKVVDFGVARVAIAKTHGPAKFTRSRLDDTIGGTPFYMSPEQIFAHPIIDHRSDMFSLGMVLYEMLRGTHPFDLEMSTRQPGQPVKIERAGIDPALADIIQKCLQQDPEKRFANVAELAVALLPFAPSRARGHADAAAALLRKAGHSIGSRMPSSVPPPALSQSTMPQGMTIPAAPGVPTFGAVATPAVPATPARKRWPLYAALAAVVLGGGGFAATRAMTATPPAPTAAHPPPAEEAAIALGGSGRTRAQAPAEPEPATTPSGAPATPASAPAKPVVGGPWPPAPKASASAAASAKGAKAAASAPGTAPAPAGTAEDLGF